MIDGKEPLNFGAGKLPLPTEYRGQLPLLFYLTISCHSFGVPSGYSEVVGTMP